MWATLGRMYKTEGGFAALYRGMIPTVAGVAPYVSLPRDAVMVMEVAEGSIAQPG